MSKIKQYEELLSFIDKHSLHDDTHNEGQRETVVPRSLNDKNKTLKTKSFNIKDKTENLISDEIIKNKDKADEIETDKRTILL